MTIEEAVRLAQNGDIGAMLSLGNYYYQQKEFDEAMEWYRPAAEKNTVYAIHMMVLLGCINGNADLLLAGKNDFGFDFAYETWNEVHKWAIRELQCIDKNMPDTDTLDRNEAISRLREIEYNLALVGYWNGNYEQSESLMSNYSDSRSKILQAASVIQLGDTADDLNKALQLLKGSIMDRSYRVSEGGRLEQKLYTVAIIQTSRIFQIKGAQNDLETAVQVLNYGLSAVSSQENKQTIADELAHYQRKMFGGYRYVK